jgi:hypothetical protein
MVFSEANQASSGLRCLVQPHNECPTMNPQRIRALPAFLFLALLYAPNGATQGAAAPAGTPQITASRILDGVKDLEASANGTSIVALQSGAVVVLSASNLTPLGTFYPARGTPTSIAADTVSETFAVGTTFGDVVLIDGSSAAVLNSRLGTLGDGNWARAMQWSPTGLFLAVEFANDTVVVYDRGFGMVGQWSKSEPGPMAWIRWNGMEALLFAADPSTLIIAPLAEAELSFSSLMAPASTIGWAMWPNGTGVSLRPSGSTNDLR